MTSARSPGFLRNLISRTAILLLFQTAAEADEPKGIGWTVLTPPSNIGTITPGENAGGDSQISLQLSPWAPEDLKANLLVVFPECGEDTPIAGKPVQNMADIINSHVTPLYDPKWTDPGPRWRVCPDSNAVLIPAGAPAKVTMTVDFLRPVAEGMSPKIKALVYQVDDLMARYPNALPQELALRVKRKSPDSQVSVDLYYQIINASSATFQLWNWRLTDWQGAFGLPLQTGAPLPPGQTGDYSQVASTLPVNVKSYYQNLKVPTATKDDKGVLFAKTLAAVTTKGSAIVPANACYAEPAVQAVDRAPALAPALTSMTISGQWSTKWSVDHALHPGWGFMAKVYETNSSGGVLRTLGTSWVQSGGTWSIPVAVTPAFTGGFIRVDYLSYNTYYAPMNQASQSYYWTDPIWAVPAGSTSFAVGHRFADTDGGTYTGVGELVDAAMTMWSRLFWSGGINPVPASPIKFYYPNTFYNCGGSSPWSCANLAGNIWLIPSHGTDPTVVNHEMGHQLNFKFWSSRLPAGSGGSHSYNGCYPTRLGMALTEGFANYVAAWVGYPDRSEDAGAFSDSRWSLGYDPESRAAPPDCADGKTNEVWVARTFWDLHDTHYDGDDNLWFNHMGAVIALYLNNGIAKNGDARDMSFYETVYRNAASPGHQNFISNIFRQNRN